jgi:hypothetical protein
VRPQKIVFDAGDGKVDSQQAIAGVDLLLKAAGLISCRVRP